jgi:hypothetical protein
LPLPSYEEEKDTQLKLLERLQAQTILGMVTGSA